MALSWVSVNANDGSIIADLPTLKVDGSLKQTLMRYESQTASLPLGDPNDPADPSRPPKEWRQATRKGAVFLVALDEPEGDDQRGRPLWGGMVIRRITSSNDDVKLSLVTAEGYFDRVYMGNEKFTGIPQNTIVKTLVEKYAKTGAKRGLPIRVQVIGGLGEARGKEYTDAEDKTLYSVLTELSGMLGGPEWTVGWEWVDTQRLGLVLYVGDRIGSPPPAGLGPAAQFYLPGSVTSAELTEGYGSDEGANDVMAVSSGVDDARPQSPHQTNTADLRPRFEYRWAPDTNISANETLTSHAQRALAAMKDGTVALTLTANRDEAPKLGKDWFIGDDVGFDLTAPAWPDGISGTARAVGWELTNTEITPLIDVTNIEGID
ncbi:minor tail protein [Arthrobacter phage TripleJ]|uniref:Minor tail protein n=1 Tax=Arthrobacter phage TripleJ TaxID=2599838 RepID=A0A5J6TFK2_9CAUD|nr:minor tail protein [Arthrobacter phage TripleJ]QFG09570.1 minor tail protein [Arthrobacter phage TripleJ]